MHDKLWRPGRVAPVASVLLLALVAGALRPEGLAVNRRPAILPAGRPAAATSAPLLFSSGADYLDAGLQSILDSALDGVGGNWAVSVKKLDTGQYAAVNAHTPAVTASLYKLFVFYTVMNQHLQGRFSLDDVETITADDAAYDVSIGELHWNIGDQVKISALIDRMIAVSDNTAAVVLTNLVGVDNMNADLQALGLQDSALNFSPAADNMTTAADYTRLLEWIATGQVLDRESCQYMINVLLDQQLDDLLPVGLPNGTPMAHKTGTLDGLMHDAGIVYGPSGPYVITALSWNLDSYNTAYTVMPKLSQAVYQYFNGRPFQPARYFPETRQVVGPAFLLFYNSHGGKPIFGLPISPELRQGDKIVQYFERARLQRPAGGGAVVLGQVGRELLLKEGRSFDPTAKADPNDPNTLWFAATQQAIGQPFLDYWQEHGGQDTFGLPLSNIVVETRDGQRIRCQYFERARFELRGNTIELGLIGSELYARLR